jgi:hypothetical protein
MAEEYFFINLKQDVERHATDLDSLSKRIDVLQADLEVVIKFSNPNVIEQGRHYAANEAAQSSYAGRPWVDPTFLKKCRDFVARYEAKMW